MENGTGERWAWWVARAAAERRWDNLKRFNGLYLNAQVRIKPGLSYVCHRRSTTVEAT